MFGNLSVDGIVADITKKIDLLQKASNYHSAQATKHNQTASDALENSDLANKESLRASSIAQKLKDLVGA